MNRGLVGGAVGLAALAAIAVTLSWGTGIPPDREPDPAPSIAAKEAGTKPAAAAQPNATLYCEFFNFSDRNPRVGFYFAIDEKEPSPVYSQIFRREGDGTQTDFGGDAGPRPHWTFDGSDNPAALGSPDGETGIVMYGYDSKRTGTTWFEAGLRSNDYKNLGGKCRLSST